MEERRTGWWPGTAGPQAGRHREITKALRIAVRAFVIPRRRPAWSPPLAATNPASSWPFMIFMVKTCQPMEPDTDGRT